MKRRPPAGQPEPSFEIVGLLVEELLQACRGVLQGVYGLLSPGSQRGQELESLGNALVELSRLKTALSRASRYAEQSSGLEDAATLSLYL